MNNIKYYWAVMAIVTLAAMILTEYCRLIDPISTPESRARLRLLKLGARIDTSLNGYRSQVTLSDASWKGSEGDLRLLKDLPGDITITARSRQLTNHFLRPLRGANNIIGLQLCSPLLSDDSMNEVTRLPRLKTLALASEGFTDESRHFISELSQLESLSFGIGLGKSSTCTSKIFPALVALPRLVDLTLGPQIDDVALMQLPFIPMLKSLTFVNAFGVTKLDFVEKLAGLESLNLRGTRVTDESLLSLGRLPHLKHLVVPQDISDVGVARLGVLTDLETLSLSGSRVTATGVLSIAAIRNLKSVDLSGTNIDDHALTVLGQMPRLKSVGVYDTLVSTSGHKWLSRQLPSARINSHSLFPVTNKHLSAVRMLESLGIRIRHKDKGGRRCVSVSLSSDQIKTTSNDQLFDLIMNLDNFDTLTISFWPDPNMVAQVRRLPRATAS